MTESLTTAIAASGREFAPAGRPKGFRKMSDKACFRNALHLIVTRQGLRYAEGFALSGFGWVHHAWVVDSQDNAIDVTWSQQAERYVGVAFDDARDAIRGDRAASGARRPRLQRPVRSRPRLAPARRRRRGTAASGATYCDSGQDEQQGCTGPAGPTPRCFLR